MREFISYSLSKSSGYGLVLRHKTVGRAWEAIQRFLDQCTIAERIEPCALTVRADRPGDDPGVSDMYTAAVTAALGPNDEVSQLTITSPIGEQCVYRDFVWSTKHLELTSLLHLLSAQEPWPKTASNVVSARVEVVFQWRDPNSGTLLANQDAGFPTADGALRSRLSIELGRRTTIAPDVRIPFPEGSPHLPPFVRFIQSRFPATLNERHFRVATPRRKGTGYQVRKMVLSPFVAM